MNPLNHSDFAQFLGVSERTLCRYRDRIEAETGQETTFIGAKKQRFYKPEHFANYERLKSGSSKNSSALATVAKVEIVAPDRQTEQLETRIAQMQRLTATQNLSLQSQIAAMKDQIASDSVRSRESSELLSEAERNAAIARGIKRGLAEFQLENQARSAVKEQLTVEQLSNEI